MAANSWKPPHQTRMLTRAARLALLASVAGFRYGPDLHLDQCHKGVSGGAWQSGSTVGVSRITNIVVTYSYCSCNILYFK